MPPRRYRLLSTSMDELLRLAAPTGGARATLRGLPEDAKVVHVGYAPGERLGVVIESKEFAPTETADPNALPTVTLQLAELVPGPKIRVANAKTGEAREVQTWVSKVELGEEPARPEPKVRIARPGDAPTPSGRRCAACGGTGRTN